MHTKVGVIAGVRKSDEKTVDAARNLLMRYDVNREVAPYKEYPDEAYVRQLLTNCKVGSLEALAKSNLDWKNGEEGGVDERGLYFVSTRNPEGAYDAWSLLHGPVPITPDVFAHDDYSCGDIIMPDGTLRQGPITLVLRANIFTRRQKERRAAERRSEWDRGLHKIAQECSGMSLVVFDCHS